MLRREECTPVCEECSPVCEECSFSSCFRCRMCKKPATESRVAQGTPGSLLDILLSHPGLFSPLLLETEGFSMETRYRKQCCTTMTFSPF